MAPVSLLPRIFQWVFLVLAVLAALAAFMASIVLLINPHVPVTAHFGPVPMNFAGQPGFVALHPAGGDLEFTISAFRGTVTLVVNQARGFIDVVKHYVVPLWLIEMLFVAALFELLRRLFRNVGHGDSFTLNTVRLVQILGALLIVFAYVLSFLQGLATHGIFTYFAQHAVVMSSGVEVHLPGPRYVMLPRGGFFPITNPLFFSGLLVLALSEVFRQGLALKKENELTI